MYISAVCAFVHVYNDHSVSNMYMTSHTLEKTDRTQALEDKILDDLLMERNGSATADYAFQSAVLIQVL